MSPTKDGEAVSNQDKPAEKKRRGNPAWAKDPVTGKGRSGNPGGQPAWVAKVRAALQSVSENGAKVLDDIVQGRPVDTVVGDEVVQVTPRVQDRLTAIRIAFDFTLPKPDAEAVADAIRDAGPVTTREKAIAALEALARQAG